jgi:hypothetical protein
MAATVQFQATGSEAGRVFERQFVIGSGRVKFTLPWQSNRGTDGNPLASGPRSFADSLSSPLGRAVAGTLGFFFLRLGVNSHSGAVTIAAWIVCGLLFWFCFSGQLPFRGKN